MYDAPPTQDRFTVETLHSGGSDAFLIDDLIVSTTDQRGVISGFNKTFRKTSEYEIEDLEKAPHKIIRHPDMPKGLFHLLWEHLKAGEMVGAYIKNRAKSGAHYWVFAVIAPHDSGYLSVRMKPSSELFSKIAAIYEDLVAGENNGWTPQESAKALCERVEDLGFQGYPSFMHASIAEETISRGTLIGRPIDSQLDLFVKVRDAVEEIRSSIHLVDAIFKETHQIPFNMRLQAGRLEGTAGPISVISSNHREMTQRLENAVHQFHGAKGLSSDVVVEGGFFCAAALLQQEILQELSSEGDDADDVNSAELIEKLQQNIALSQAESLKLTNSISDRISQFSGICRDVRRLMSGLELTRIMCKIERSKQTMGTEGLDEIINRLTDAQDRLSGALTKIEDVSSEAAKLVEGLNGPKN